LKSEEEEEKKKTNAFSFSHSLFCISLQLSLPSPKTQISLSFSLLLPLERRDQLQDHQEDVDDVEVDRQAREDVLVGAQRDGFAACGEKVLKSFEFLFFFSKVSFFLLRR